MNKLVTAVLFVFTGATWAQDSDLSATEDEDKVDLYISVIENIDVTAEKEPRLTGDDLDDDIAALLAEAEKLEEQDSSE